MLYLYHGTTSVCAIKVRLTLNEKKLPWQGEILHLQRGDQLRPEYRKINPNAVVPTLIHDSKVIIESTIIIEYLDEMFTAPALMPADLYQRAVARLWMKKIDDYLHESCSSVTFAIAFRQYLLKKTPEQLEAHFAAMPDPVRRERQRLSVLRGVEAPHVAPALRNYNKFIAEMEEALASSPYLAGERYSLADIAATPYVNRAEMLGMEGLWVGRRPRVTDWLTRIRQRPSYDEITKYFTLEEQGRFEVPREQTWKKVRAVLEID
jgi:glutathione S-transferase